MINSNLGGKASSSHTHDDRYFTESEMNTKLNTKQNTIKFDVSCTLIRNTKLISESDVYVRQWGAVTHIHLWVKTKVEYPTYKTQVLFTNCPLPLYSAENFAATFDSKEYIGAIINIAENGDLQIEVRDRAVPANKIFKGSITYIRKTVC